MQVRYSNPLEAPIKLKFVEKYKKPEAFCALSEGDKGELFQEIAPLVSFQDEEMAKRFDNFMYGMIIASMEQMPAFQNARKNLCQIASALEKKTSIPQVKDKLDLIQDILTDQFWNSNDVLLYEETREKLRELIKFLEQHGKTPITTSLKDPIIDQKEGEQLEAAYDFEDYREKVNRYIGEHGETMAIHKLTHNIKLSAGDYQELERILTLELGSKEDYERAYGDTPFGLLVRKIAKMDHEAAMEAFSAFINDQSLNQRQISFVHKIINHVEKNGYMESVAVLQKPPFDKPVSFLKLFDAPTRKALLSAINEVKDNAVNIAM